MSKPGPTDHHPPRATLYLTLAVQHAHILDSAFRPFGQWQSLADPRETFTEIQTLHFRRRQQKIPQDLFWGVKTAHTPPRLVGLQAQSCPTLATSARRACLTPPNLSEFQSLLPAPTPAPQLLGRRPRVQREEHLLHEPPGGASSRGAISFGDVPGTTTTAVLFLPVNIRRVLAVLTNLLHSSRTLGHGTQ